MSGDAPAITPARSWPRAELTLAVLAALSLLLNSVHILYAYRSSVPEPAPPAPYTDF